MRFLPIICILAVILCLNTTVQSQETELSSSSINEKDFLNGIKEWFIDHVKAIKNFVKKLIQKILKTKDELLNKIRSKYNKLKIVGEKLKNAAKDVKVAFIESYQEFQNGTTDITETIKNLEPKVDKIVNTTLKDIEETLFDVSNDIKKISDDLYIQLEQIPENPKEGCSKNLLELEIKQLTQESVHLAAQCAVKAKDQITETYQNIKNFVSKVFHSTENISVKILKCVVNTKTCKSLLGDGISTLKEHSSELKNAGKKLMKLPTIAFNSVKCLAAEENATEQRRYLLSKAIKQCVA